MAVAQVRSPKLTNAQNRWKARFNAGGTNANAECSPIAQMPRASRWLSSLALRQTAEWNLDFEQSHTHRRDFLFGHNTNNHAVTVEAFYINVLAGREL